MPHTKRAFDFLNNTVLKFKDELQPTSLLYVGWRHDCRPWWYDNFAKNLGVRHVGVLEIFSKNIHDLHMKIWEGKYPDVRAILGDVRNAERHIRSGEYDIIFWDHGPEHVEWEELKSTTDKLCKIAGKMVLYCAPWGNWPQGEEDGNVHEIHRISLTKENFEELGLETYTMGREGQDGEGELVGFRYIR